MIWLCLKPKTCPELTALYSFWIWFILSNAGIHSSLSFFVKLSEKNDLSWTSKSHFLGLEILIPVNEQRSSMNEKNTRKIHKTSFRSRCFFFHMYFFVVNFYAMMFQLRWPGLSSWFPRDLYVSSQPLAAAVAVGKDWKRTSVITIDHKSNEIDQTYQHNSTYSTSIVQWESPVNHLVILKFPNFHTTQSGCKHARRSSNCFNQPVRNVKHWRQH